MGFNSFRGIVGICLAAAVLSLGCSPEEAPPPPPPKVEVFAAFNEDIAESFEYIAQAVAYDEVELVARVSGFIEERGFEPGQMVKKGQLLFKIEQTSYKAKVEAAKAVIDQMEAAVDLAEIEHQRQKTLYEKNAVSKDKLDNAVADLRTAEANLRKAKAELIQEKLNLDYTLITAPFDGRIGNYNFSVGNMVGPDSKSLANLTRIEPMKVRFHVSERDMANAVDKMMRGGHERGERTIGEEWLIPWVTLPNGAHYPHSGHLLFEDNRINPRTGTIMVQAEFPNPDFLLVPGQYLNITLLSVGKSPALLVPQAAMQQDQGGAFVLVVKDDNTIERRVVVVGKRYGEFIIVRSGIKEGERVVSKGLQKVRPGMKVEPVAASIAKPQAAPSAAPASAPAASAAKPDSAPAAAPAVEDKEAAADVQ